jgi:hypothetical protein
MVLRLNAETPQASLDALKVGDIVTLGTYDMDNDPENGKESITWRVLAIENGKALIISEICVDAAKYNAQKGEVTWETSDIRAQLNDKDESFYATAFDEGEKEYILSSTIKNSDNAYHDSEGGNDTEDRVFLLSFDEAEQYFNSDEDRIAKASMAAIANGGECFDSRTKSQAAASPESNDYMAISWWLRSPGENGKNAANVLYFGQANPVGSRTDLAVRGIRPAMWVKTTNEVLPETILTVDNLSSAVAGSKVSFGSYEQDGDNRSTEAIIWEVLKVEDGKATLISEKILDRVLYLPFDYSETAGAGATSWSESNLRSWLNDTFITAFSAEEQAIMVTTELENAPNALTGAGGCENTFDKIYVLSSNELKALIPNALDRKAEATEYAKANGVYVDAPTACSDWWLRDVGSVANTARTVLYYGGIDTDGKLVKNDYIGVRPVITVTLSETN